MIVLFFFALPFNALAGGAPSFSITVSVDPGLLPSFIPGGRLIFHLTAQREKDPRFKSEITMGITPVGWNPSKPFTIKVSDKQVLANGLEKLTSHAKFYYQAVYKQNQDDGNENVEGNLYSSVDSIEWNEKARLHVTLHFQQPPLAIVQHPFVKSVVLKSTLLSAFSGRPRYLKASILLPSGYFQHPDTSYPICYRIPGLNGRYDQVNGQINNKDFNDWWFSPQAPQVIYVFLDSQGPYGDTYQMDSENNGPCGKALTEELIPAIEQMVHYNPASGKRFLAGKSTGGWVALGLQVFYPDFFKGTWSYSPDPVDFEHYGLIDIYHDSSVFYNRYGYL
jgi:enterochelin esterase-like enzyme